MKANYLICYDIADKKRLTRVFKTVKGKGLHLQYSVFLCRLTWKQLQELKERLNKLIDSKYDDVRIYPLPDDIKVEVLGCGDRVPEGVNIFLS